MASPSINRVLALATVIAMSLLAGAAGSVSAMGGGTTYVKAVPVCSAPSKTAKVPTARCYAMKLIKVSAGSPGARPMTVVDNGPAGGYTPQDLAAAYGVNPAAATTLTVAIVDAYNDPNVLADLNFFNAHYGLPAETATSFKVVNQSGAASPLPANDAGWGVEITLDVQSVRAMCHACKIILVEGNSSSFADLATATNRAVTMGAKIVSNSYGGAESGAPIDPTILAAYNHPGVAILASTGDDGMFGWDHMNTGSAGDNAPSLPASLNTVVAVGGTTLYLNPDATRASEIVWNENGPHDQTGWNFGSAMGATGGGCSITAANTAKGWQANAVGYAQAGCAGKRLAADVSALADPYTGFDIYDTFQQNGWLTLGGTSLATPLLAGMWALVGGLGGIPYPSLTLYGHYKSDATKPFYDVTAGGNGFCNAVPRLSCSNYSAPTNPNGLGYGKIDCYWQKASPYTSTGVNTRECDAATGYDGPSGIGTPKGLNVFVPLYPTVVITKPASITHAVSANFSGTSSTDPFPGGSITGYSWNWGDGSALSTTASPSHTYAAAGNYTITLTVHDNYGIGRAGSVGVTVN